ncbi:MAG: MurR/RpiR family transcriptional regulator [Firmicutes bacterium]|nr:MurR/RpiR family transcriptional regulator [Bacillota bacterium]
MKKFIDKFSEDMPNLRHLEKSVLYFVDKNLQRASKLALAELAEVTNVSTTTIVRMCKNLHLNGYAHFKIIMQECLAEGESPKSSFLQCYQEDIWGAMHGQSEERLQEVAGIVLGAERVVIISVGLTKMIGEYLSKLFMQVGRPSIYLYESHLIELVANDLTAKDVVIFLTSSGETKTLIRVAEKLMHSHIRMVVISNSADSTLAKFCSHRIGGNTKKSCFSGYDVSTRTTLMIYIDLLFESFLRLKDAHAKENPLE